MPDYMFEGAGMRIDAVERDNRPASNARIKGSRYSYSNWRIPNQRDLFIHGGIK